jgi:hypothetical protein
MCLLIAITTFLTILRVPNTYQLFAKPENHANRTHSKTRIIFVFNTVVGLDSHAPPPKSVVNRALAEGLEDVRKGRVKGPFKTADEMIHSLKFKGRPRRTLPKRSQ